MTINELRKLRNNISVKIYNRKKKNKDTTDLETQLIKVREKIKNYKIPTPVKHSAKNTSKPVGKNHIQVQQTVKPNVINKQNVIDKGVFSNQPIPGSWKKPELKKFMKDVEGILDSNDWSDGYQFRSSECMFIRGLETKLLVGNVAVRFTMEYKTKARKCINNITRYFTPGQSKDVQTWIDNLETWVMLNSGDLDDKQIVFGERFNKVQFDAKNMMSQGWIIKK